MRRADEFTAPPPRGDDDGWLPPDECAKQMSVSLAELDALIRRGAVRARRVGWAVEVQPCIVNVTPRPESSSPRRASGTTKNTPHTRVRGRK